MENARTLIEALNSIPVGVVVLDNSFKTTFINNWYRQFFDLDASTCPVGINYAEILTILADRGEFGLGHTDTIVCERIRPVRGRKKASRTRIRPNGQVVAVDGTPLESGGYIYIFTDATTDHRNIERMKAANKATVLALADLAEFRDSDTGDHVIRVACLTQEITQVLRRDNVFPTEITEDFCNHIAIACVLHDVGKVSIPDAILHKPIGLVAEERRVIQTHSPIGAAILNKAAAMAPDSQYLIMGTEIAHHHHERFDGNGYPDRLAGDRIPLAARIVAVADVFDALTSRRPYKDAWPIERAVTLIVEQADRQFDSRIITAFLKVIEERRNFELIQWSESLSVNSPILDRDHRVIIELTNCLMVANKTKDRIMMEFMIDELVGYATVHFAREEEHMDNIGYGQLTEHKIIHRRLLKDLRILRESFRINDPDMGEHVENLINTWIHEHVTNEDSKFATWVTVA